MDLFDFLEEENKNNNLNIPLAQRMKPRTLDEVEGQEHILGKNKLLYRAIKADKLGSIILYGPPGTGKTSIAKVIANTTKCNFVQINATTAGKKEMEEAINSAKNDLYSSGKKTILFVDEIHRFNKSQQDFLLPFIEDGTVIFIGATTENPYFEVNGALISRSNIFELKPLSRINIENIIKKAVSDKERGLGNFNINITDEAVSFIAEMSGGDARSALNAIELAVITTSPDSFGIINIDINIAQDCIQKKAFTYDKNGDNHYNVISAFIKSMRGSDPDAAVFYLAKMLAAGEDISFIARRIVICASEDVGDADPTAAILANACAQTAERVGMPEARIPLAQAAIYVACAPKSNSVYLAIDKALDYVSKNKDSGVPFYLCDAHYPGAAAFDHGKGYKYPHDYEGHYVQQQYLPDSVKEVFYKRKEK